MLCLQKIEGRSYNPSLQPEKVLLKPALTRFGRSNQHSDVIDSSISPLMISRVHAEIHFDDGRFRIDCKGLNGLLVNKTKRSSAVLCDGDEMKLFSVALASKRKRDRFCLATIQSLCMFLMRSAIVNLKKGALLERALVMEEFAGEAKENNL